MWEMLGNLIDVIISLSIWAFVFCLYGFFGAFFGAFLARRKKHDSDNLGWIVLGILIFTTGLFPLTYYLFYTG